MVNSRESLAQNVHKNVVEFGWLQGNLTEGKGSVQLTSLYLTSLDQLLLTMKTLFTFFALQATLMRR
jgi:hypothetical protein